MEGAACKLTELIPDPMVNKSIEIDSVRMLYSYSVFTLEIDTRM
ncbi:hypothetical protein AO9_03415 [Chlamydia psittaci Mat116]|nr:hypothetical protein G5O_0702 [Chlamydia psittaci 6BC]AGE75241.1 hypothetical protein AO9_03415 [Chlamydia psittaci Mat116]